MALYARIQDGRVFEFYETEGDISQMFHPSLIWVSVEGVVGIEQGWSAHENDGEWSFEPYTPPPPTPEQIIASQSSTLQQLNQLAAAQKAALTNRIGVINDAIEFEEATQQEIAELPIRQVQLTAWKRYAVLLGRVTAQEGWPPNVIWPEQPAEGMDLTVSAARSVQASI